MKYILLFSAAAFLLFVSFSCSSPTSMQPTTGGLTVSDFSCTEAWINLNAGAIVLPANIILKKNGSSFLSLTLSTRDTTIYDSTLSPNQSYTYQAMFGSNIIGTATVRTMDTTSSNYTWQTFTFGDAGAGSSVLNDVAIINDTLAYAVGAIYVNDSTGQPDPQPYNLAKWNGKNWILQKVTSTALRAVYAFGPEDVWAGTSAPYHWDGTTWKGYNVSGIFGGYINKIWGSASNDLYIVGGNGSIAHYQNGSWQKIESGTDVDLLDINGATNSKTIWISGYEDFKPTVLLKYNNNSLTTIINDQSHLLNNYPGIISGGIESIWTNNPNDLFLLTWYGLYRIENNNFNSPKNIWSGDPNTWGLIRVRGNNTNDITAVGINGRIWHYNGVNWQLYNELINNTDTYYSVATYGNICIAVGYRYINGVVRYGLIQIGHR